MVLLGRYSLLPVLLIALFVTIAIAETKEESVADSEEQIVPKPVQSSLRMLRTARASPKAQHPAAGHRGGAGTASPAGPAAADAKKSPASTPEREYEQQVLVVKGNPSEEKLNEEIRKAIRALLGPGQGDQVQIRELKTEEELRRVAPGARPIGVRLVP